MNKTLPLYFIFFLAIAASLIYVKRFMDSSTLLPKKKVRSHHLMLI
jgi:hypothetical protein